MLNVAMVLQEQAEQGVPTTNLIVLGVLIVIAAILLVAVMKKRRARE
ncbi:MAG: hypothetical protein N0A16_06035 [Blastocatellia bacterium]|nr:hypothetical protein [Blastocatellia bacterium]